MNAFLWGPGFQRVVDDFGRPVVQHWTGLAYEERDAARAEPASEVRHRVRIPEAAPLSALMEQAVSETARLTAEDGALSAAVAVDPRHWELVHFSLWDQEAPDTAGEVFQVLHVSAPERDRLPRG